MPNYQISPRLQNDMNDRMRELTTRRISHMQSGFPISPEKVQQSILPSKWRQIIVEMLNDDIQLNKEHYGITVAIYGLPGLDRRVTLVVTNHVFTTVSRHNTQDFDLSALTPSECVELSKWVNTLITETRMAQLANEYVRRFLNTESVSKSVGHILTNWPALIALVEDKNWKRKFSDRPKSLNKYKLIDITAAERFNKQAKTRQIAEMLINSALMLPAYTPNGMIVKVTTWEKLPDDLDNPPR